MSRETQTLEHTERVLYLRTVPAFRGLPAGQLAAIAEQTRERYFRSGQVLLPEGEPVSAIHMVIEGRVMILRGDRILNRLGPLVAVGTVGLFARGGVPVRAVAEVDALTLELERDAMLELLADNFTILRHIIQLLTRTVLNNRRELGPNAGYPSEPLDVDVPRPERELDLIERLFFLRQVFPFARSSLNAIVDLARHAEEVWFPRGEQIWRQGGPCGHIYVLHSGTVRGEADAGRQRFYLNAGNVVGAVDNMADLPRWYDAFAQTDVRALRLSGEHFLDMIEDRFELAQEFLEMVADDLLQVLELRAAQAQPARAGEEPEQLLAATG